MADDGLETGGNSPSSGPPASGGRGLGGKLKTLFSGKKGAAVGIVLVGVVVGGYVLLRSRAGRAPAGSQAGVVANPLAGTTQPGDAVGSQLEGLQSQIGNLVAQASSVAGGNTTPTDQLVDPNLGSSNLFLHTSASNESPVGGIVTPGQSLVEVGNAIAGGSYTSPTYGITGNQWVPVRWNGVTMYAFSPEVKPHHAT